MNFPPQYEEPRPVSGTNHAEALQGENVFGSHHSPTQPEAKPATIPWAWAVGSLAAGLVIGAGVVGSIWGASSVIGNSPATFIAQYDAGLEECGIEVDDLFVERPESGDSVTFDGVGLSYSPVDLSDVVCFGEQLDMPSHITSEMGQTRALDGRQQSEWSGFSVSWSYHPDSGMNAVFSVTATG